MASSGSTSSTFEATIACRPKRSTPSSRAREKASMSWSRRTPNFASSGVPMCRSPTPSAPGLKRNDSTRGGVGSLSSCPTSSTLTIAPSASACANSSREVLLEVK